ncbi:MAG: [acyl-carrier-protein] S-malonyltransferase [Spartobacteria bacterium]|nr:[acyl-carrier-protein] S-malonyltransferase [Spartobacteria bacterium]
MSNAIVFPGQGAQAVGMAAGVLERFPDCRGMFDEAGEILGYDLAALCAEGPQELLTQSDRAQPAIFVVSAACYAMYKETASDFECAMTAGLSSGEWTALYAANVLSFGEVVRVLAARGKFMQEACEEQKGGMLSVIGLNAEQVEKVALDAGLEMANFNSQEQIVLSGPVERIERAVQIAKDAGAKRAIPLNVAGAFHSSMMNSAAEKLAEFLAPITFSAPSMPVISNVTARPHEADTIRELMVKQVNSPVKFVDSVLWMQSAGVDSLVECGPGKVLSGLVKRIDKQLSMHSIQGF